MSLFNKLQENKNATVTKEKEEGVAFLQTNGSKEGIVSLQEGIQYSIVKEGTGPKPALSNTIKAHYKGALLNGTEFDNSFKRGTPFTAKITALIKGWQIVLPMMPAGSLWRLWIPSDYGYGDSGVAQAGIPGGGVLVFDIELLEILD